MLEFDSAAYAIDVDIFFNKIASDYILNTTEFYSVIYCSITGIVLTILQVSSNKYTKTNLQNIDDLALIPYRENLGTYFSYY